MSETKPLFVCDDNGKMWVADVPTAAVPFGIAATCPTCPPDHRREIHAINFVTRKFRCSTRGGVSSESTEHADFPALGVEVPYTELAPLAVITDYSTGEKRGVSMREHHD